MQGNGFKVFLAVAFLILSGYYLYPTVRSYFIHQKLEKLEGEDREAYERENFGTIQSIQEKSLKLGLDLQGGMHATLEVQVDALIRELATDTDQTFDEVLAAARQRSDQDDTPVVDAFVQEFEARDPSARLSRYFRNTEMNITRRSSNAEVANYLRSEADEAVNRAIEIVRQRIDRFGVTEPLIQRQGSRRIVVELPGVDDRERVRRLLRGTARLEFRLMAEPDDVRRSLQAVIEHYEESGATSDTSAAIASEDGAATDTAAAADADTSFDVTDLLAEDEGAANPLLDVLQPVGQGVQFALVAESDTAEARRLLSAPEVAALLPPGVTLMYTSAPVATTEDGHELYHLLAVRDIVELTGEVITDARVQFNELNQAEVSMTMNAEGARTWARITGANVNKPVAIVLDRVVYSYPTVINRIVGGRSQITGLESREEAQDVVTILKSGALPAPLDIIEERVVGPSLGEASIRAGLICVIVGLTIVALFMIFWYRGAGMVADLALILTIIFILGVLAGFRATLTLPGIAGIVLTIGMAVDANVLIFERVREEHSTGKTLKAAIDGGFEKAFSSIFDGNVTTFFVGAILYSFGVGPIRGFAVTLMTGIIASMFSALVISRFVFDYFVAEKRLNVKFG